MGRFAVVALAVAVLVLGACTRDSGPTTEHLGWSPLPPAGAVLLVRVAHGACDNGPHAHLRETRRKVTLDVTTQADGGACIGVLKCTVVGVYLKLPLGDRRLVGSPRDAQRC